MNLREHALAGPVAAWMRADGYEVWAEVPTLFGLSAIDLVGRRGQELRLVELKTGWTQHLLHQCMLHQLTTVDVWAATPCKPRHETMERFSRQKIGMLRVTERGACAIIPPSFRYAPHQTYIDRLHDHLNHMTPGEKGGMPNMPGEGPAQACMAAIQAYGAANKGRRITWKELYEKVPNHYSNYRSMQGAMRMLQIRSALK